MIKILKGAVMAITAAASIITAGLMFGTRSGLTAADVHSHKVCGDLGCTDDSHGEAISDWTELSAPNEDGSLDMTGGGHYYLANDIVITGQTMISKDTVLCLNGHTISYNGERKQGARFFYVYQNAAFTLCDCKGSGQEGKLTGSKEEAQGGAVYVSGATFNMYGGIITDNENGKPTDEQYAYHTEGGAVYISKSTFNMYGGAITNNSLISDTGHGGGVIVKDNGTFTMWDGEISGNSASSYGGGVNVSFGGAFTMHGGKISDNKTTGSGGRGGGVYVSSVKPFVMTDGIISNNETSEQGGGVYVGGGDFNMSGGRILRNKVTTEKSQYTGGGGVFTSGTFEMTGGLIQYNEATYSGGGVLVSGTSAKLTMDLGSICNNKTTGINYGGGGVCVDGGTLEITNKSFINYNETNADGGGVLVLSGGTFTASDSLIINNTAKKGGGLSFNYAQKVEISRSTIDHNTAERGAGIYTSASLDLYHSSVGENTAKGGNEYGGAIFISRGTLTTNNCTLYNNKAEGEGKVGGGVVNMGGTFKITDNTTITNNTASKGGGIYLYEGDLILDGKISMYSNTTAQSGGSNANVYIERSRYTPMIIIGDNFSTEKPIGVSTSKSLLCNYTPNYINITANGTADVSESFVSEADNQYIAYDKTNQTVQLKAEHFNLEKIEEVKATCTAKGNKEYWHCTQCNKCFEDGDGKKETTIQNITVDALGHDWDEENGNVTKEPSCTEKGIKSVSCKRCRETKEIEIEMLEHTKVVDPAVEATCTEAGKTEGSHCSVCNTVIKAQETIPAKGHTKVVDPAVEATCTEAGKTEGSHCSVCNTV
ncbi:MAG TPA: hypothetical protein DDX91_09760, partial [Ruminococcaceae bacterium]|nr:hypothetical protein [Oscillospiraceae bacterium]